MLVLILVCFISNACICISISISMFYQQCVCCEFIKEGIKLFKFSKLLRKDNSDDMRKMVLIEEIQSANRALNAAYMGFNNALEPDMIDCYIYEVNSIQMRYKLLIENAKSLGITYDKNVLPEPVNPSCEVNVQSLL